MSGTTNNGQGQRALFANAPVLPAPQTIPVVPSGSNLAAAMMAQNHGTNLQTPSFGSAIPLSSMLSMMKDLKGTPNPTPGNNQTGLVRAADGSWVAGPTMGQVPSPDFSALQAAGAFQEPQQAQMPGSPTAGAPGLVGLGAPGMPGAMPAPGMPSQGAPGTGGPDQPGLFGQTMSWLQSLYGGGGGG